MTPTETTTTLPTPGKCACGAEGSWSARHAVIGTSAGKKVAWAGCPYHLGTATSAPVPRARWLRLP